jgi:hypothetical protein
MSEITLKETEVHCIPVLYCVGVLLFIIVIFCLYSWRCTQSSISACADIYYTTYKFHSHVTRLVARSIREPILLRQTSAADLRVQNSVVNMALFRITATRISDTHQVNNQHDLIITSNPVCNILTKTHR